MKSNSLPLLLLSLFGLSLFLGGCGSSSGSRSDSRQVEQRLMQQYQQWRGTPYRLGGITQQGVDCSAFVMLVFRNGFGVEIPRTTDQQMRHGTRIRPQQLRVGDLVFFQTGRNTRHVGIVLSGGRFMHASTSQGVIIDELNQAYWQQRFTVARRVL
ncbi:lipoprotein Spr/probable lipoprotein NlpC [Cyclonatronum proteinivorum]|uniref:Lipoprotein Spr/probable lipoprotein NlpC n=1 Tax=Cyclonatronum proteinivorum TaxID=1457365 RepID=A0A345UGS1_9BACT|nr:NlpC/P60 family protein [Cyclonatronum proteinivorum]AXI99672.1 lipoprotein Spr/probable lipoprotein NlpC [Cyclonatronum proteinivorum]